MSTDLAIVGVIEPPDQEVERLQAENRKLKRQLSDAETEGARAREDADRALGMLRKQLSPLYRALQAVFGELDAAGVGTYEHPDPVPSSMGAQPTRVAAVWESWKLKLGATSAPARVIDALLIHGAMNVPQLKVAGKMANQTVYDAVSKLNKLGLIDKNGGRYSLKQL